MLVYTQINPKQLDYLYQGCTAREPDPAPERVISGPRSRLKNTRNVSCMNDGDFMNEFKFH